MPQAVLATASGPTIAPLPPGLTALIVYLRPISRPELLADLAQLGLFVSEITDAQIPAALSHQIPAPDIVVVVGRTCEEHLAAVRELAELTPALAAIWPVNENGQEVEAAGAAIVGSDGQIGALSGLIAPVARLARDLRTARSGGGNAPQAVFSNLRLETGPARLEGEGQTVRLSNVEYAVLNALARSKGRPVGAGELGAAARTARPGSSGLESQAFVGPTVARLRRKATLLGGEALALSNVRGFGYVLTR